LLLYLQRGTIALIVALFFSSSASARPPYPLEQCGKKQAAKLELHCARRALWHHAGAARWIISHKSRTLEATSTAHQWRSRLRFERWRVRVNRRHIAEARARLAPSVGHLALWLCIHSREGAWTDQGAPYFGGLQMTYGWAGLVGNAALLSPLQQMRAAETGYRRSGYSRAWLFGQWPNTAPPCGALA
jgi:hypothetical protein